MTVVDASVAIKWFLDESGSDEAKALLVRLTRAIVVPDIFLIEVTGALVRQANAAKTLRDPMQAHIDHLLTLFEAESLRTVRLELSQLAKASRLAMDLGHPLKDCFYLTLAMELGCELVTCDARFAVKAKGIWAGVQLLGERANSGKDARSV